jgi:hypothetical protein
MKRRRFCAALLLAVLCASGAYSQSPLTEVPTVAAPPQKTVFPQWARDLRRAEIIAFGAFPFMMLFAGISVDTYRSANHNWDSRYYPWPLKPAGAIEMSRDEHMLTLGIAAAGSLVIALADHIIIRIKRARAEKQRLDLPEGELIILRKPWPLEEAADADAVGDGASGGNASDGEAGVQDGAAGGESGDIP